MQLVPLVVYVFLWCGCRAWCGEVEAIICDCEVESLLLIFCWVSNELGWVCGSVSCTSLDSECCLDKVVVGVECRVSVGGDVQDCVFPGLCSEKVV